MSNKQNISQAAGFDRNSGTDMVALADVVAAIVRRRRLVVATMAVVTALGFVYAIFSQPIYAAKVVVQSADDSQGGTMSSLTNRFGNAASLVGIDLSNADVGRKKNIGILRSRELALRFIKKEGLLPHLFPERWDDEQKSWKPLSDSPLSRVLRWVRKTMAELSDDQGWQPPVAVPGDWEALKRFDLVFRIEENIISGMITVAVEFPDPELAAQWANDFIALANDDIRAQTIDEASRALAYLNAKGTETSFAGLREAIYGLVENQLQTITLANSREQFAFRVIDEATLSKESLRPQRALIVAVAMFAGALIGALVAVAMEFLGLGGLTRPLRRRRTAVAAPE